MCETNIVIWGGGDISVENDRADNMVLAGLVFCCLPWPNQSPGIRLSIVGQQGRLRFPSVQAVNTQPFQSHTFSKSSEAGTADVTIESLQTT